MDSCRKRALGNGFTVGEDRRDLSQTNPWDLKRLDLFPGAAWRFPFPLTSYPMEGGWEVAKLAGRVLDGVTTVSLERIMESS